MLKDLLIRFPDNVIIKEDVQDTVEIYYGKRRPILYNAT
jgi:hypothetical protein